MKIARGFTVLFSLALSISCAAGEPIKQEAAAFAQEWSKEHFVLLKNEEKAVVLKYLKAEEACIREFKSQEANPVAKFLRFIWMATGRRYQDLRSYPTGLKAAKDFLPLSSAATKSYLTFQAKLKAYCIEKVQESFNDKYFALYEAQAAEEFIKSCINEAELQQEFFRELQKKVHQY